MATVADFNANQIERKIGYVFNNKALLKHAFVHSSYAYAQNIADNERMEFLGDAILGYIVSEYMFANYPEKEAGDLTNIRLKNVSASGLKPIVEQLGLMAHLRIVDGDLSAQKSEKIPSNLFEAVLAAIYLDGGLHCAREFVLSLLTEQVDAAATALNDNSKALKDDVTKLNEYCQAKNFKFEFKFLEKTGPDNNPIHTYALYIDGKQVALGTGLSKKVATQLAAQKIVEEWRID